MDTKMFAAFMIEEEEEEAEMMSLLVRRETNELYKCRKSEGHFITMIQTHFVNDEEMFRNFFRLNTQQFDFVLSLVGDELLRRPTNAVQEPISAKEKLAITLRYLATGESFTSLGYGFRISPSYVSIIVEETLERLCKYLVPLFLPTPTQEIFKKNAQEFLEFLNFANCCAAVDGKHVRIRCPAKSGSLFWNYKGYFSIVLLAMVDANCKFVCVDVGSYGKEGDSVIFNKSEMGKMVLKGDIFPPDACPPLSEEKLPFVVIGDEAFRLQRHVLKPYTRTQAQTDKSKTVFNYRLSLARRVSENAFGLLCQVFRVFYSTISVKPDTCDKLIIACCCLHNLLRDAYLEKKGRPFHDIDSEMNLPQNIVALPGAGGFVHADAFRIRDAFKDYFNKD